MGRRKQKIRDVAPRLSHIYSYFWPEFRRQGWLISGSIVALIGSVVFRLLEPWPLKIFLDDVLPVSEVASTPAWLADMTPIRLLWLITIATVAITAVRASCDYISSVGFFLVGNRAVLRIRNRVFRHLLQLPLKFHHRARTGDQVIRVTRDVSLLRDVTATAVLPLAASVFVLAGMLAVMFWLQAGLALLSLVTVPLFWLATVRLGRKIRETTRRQRAREGAMATTAAESISSIAAVKALGLEDKFARDFCQRNAESQKDDLKANRYSVRLGRTIDILLALSTAIVLYFGGRMVLQSKISAGDLIVFLYYLKRSFKPSQDFAKYTARLAKATAAGERVIDLLERRPDIVDLPKAEPLPATDAPVEFRLDHVSFAYEHEHPVLQDLSCTAPAGQITAVVGPSGAGKSTILHLALRLFDPQSGRLLVDDRDLRQLTVESLRRQTTIVMQDCLLFAGTIRDNITLGRPEFDDTEVRAALQLANAVEFVDRLPDGWNTAVGERGYTLSRGQRQRLAIARAALRGGTILLLDEPTTGLDEANEQAVVDGLLRLARGRTTLLVTHDIALAQHADQVLYLDRGCVLEAGTPDELLQAEGPFAALVQQEQARRQRSFRPVAPRGPFHVPMSLEQTT